MIVEKLKKLMKKSFKYFGGIVCASGFATTGYCYVISQRSTSEKLHVVIDLDSTILQSFPIKSFDNINHANVRKHDHVINDNESDSGELQKGYMIWHRPFAHWSLWFLNQLFVVHVFTAATRKYGEACLFSFQGLFENQRLFRESVTKKDSHGKDLSLITNELDRIVLVDDQLRNRTNNQQFYHIPPYTRFVKFDFELPKFCIWALRWQLSHDINNLKN